MDTLLLTDETSYIVRQLFANNSDVTNNIPLSSRII